MRKAKLQQLEAKIALCQEFAQMWAEFFGFFADHFESRKISGDDESRFFKAMTTIARKTFRCSYLIGEGFPKSDGILKILSEAVSLTNLNNMSDAQFGKFQHSWHVVYIRLNKCLGRLIEQRPMPKKKKGEEVAETHATDEIVQSMQEAKPQFQSAEPEPEQETVAK